MLGLGLFAGTLTTAAFIPQMVVTVKTKKTDNMSFMMYFLTFVGVLVWGIYGIVIHNIPLIIFEATTLMLMLPILITIIVNNRKNKRL